MFDVWNAEHRAEHCEKSKSQVVAKDISASIVLIHITKEAIEQGG